MSRLSLTLLVLFVTTPLFIPAEENLPDARLVDYARWSPGQAYGRAEAATDWPTLAWFDKPGAGAIEEFPAGSGRHWLREDFPAGTFGGGRHGNKFAANLAPRDA